MCTCSQLRCPPGVLQLTHEWVLQLTREGHQGIVKTKTLLRTKVWCPNIDQQAEAIVWNCITCQANTSVTHSEPLQMSELPEVPWHSASADFYEPLSTGEYLLAIMDEYIQYPVVEAVKSTSANTVRPVMGKVFSTFGIPRVLKTDYGPPFNSDQFAQFATYLGCHHHKITLQWPQANATAERFMHTLGRSIRALHKNSYSHSHYQQLRSHNQSKRSCCQKQDESLCWHSSSCHTKHFQPRRHSASPSAKRNKLTIPCNAEPYKISRIKGSMINATKDGLHHKEVILLQFLLCFRALHQTLTIAAKWLPRTHHRQDILLDTIDVLLVIFMNMSSLGYLCGLSWTVNKLLMASERLSHLMDWQCCYLRPVCKWGLLWYTLFYMSRFDAQSRRLFCCSVEVCSALKGSMKVKCESCSCYVCLKYV